VTASGVAVAAMTRPSKKAADAVIAEAEESDLIAMTTHGRSGLSKLVLGSVAEAVVRSCRIPMLLRRPKG
jgi:nucleotide-binding universal stress UspA family protein